MRRGILVILIIVVAGIVSFVLYKHFACHPPTQKILKVKTILKKAKEANAPLYARKLYMEAENLLSQAISESKTDCRRSWDTVALAEKKALMAKEKAIEGKEKAKKEAKKLIDDALEALNQAEKAEAPRFSPDLYNSARSFLTLAKKDFQEGDYYRSKDKAKKTILLSLKVRDLALKAKKLAEEKAKKKAMVVTSYTAKNGECLWIISSYTKIYGNPFMWPLIYWENKAKIRDPDLIYPGQVLSIPRNFNPSEKERAIHFARTRGPWSLFDGK